MKYPSWVYIIQHNVTRKIYVGISSNPKKRLQQHLSALRHNKHIVADLQEDYNLYGEHLSFYVVDRVDSAKDRNKEFMWQIKVRSLEREKGYNYRDPVTRWCLPLPCIEKEDTQWTTQLNG